MVGQQLELVLAQRVVPRCYWLAVGGQREGCGRASQRAWVVPHSNPLVCYIPDRGPGCSRVLWACRNGASRLSHRTKSLLVSSRG